MKSLLSTSTAISLSVALLAFILQWLGMSYLSGLSSTQLNHDTLQLKTQIAQDIANQLSRALADQDDLAALAAIKSARSNHPQLQSLLVFDSQGRIALHTEPGMMGKKVKAPQGPRLAKPVIKQGKINGRSVTVIMTALPEDDDYYCRLYFNNHKAIQSEKSYTVRFYILIILVSALLGLFTALRLKRFVLINPDEKVAATNYTAVGQILAKLALNKSTIMIIDRQNKILAIDPGLFAPGNQATDKFIGKHIMRSALPKDFINAISRITKTPDQSNSVILKINPNSSDQTVKLSCYPANQDWQFIVVRL